MRNASRTLLAHFLTLIFVSSSHAQDVCSPIEDVGCGLSESSICEDCFSFGECGWIDCKQHLAESGIDFQGNLTQFYFGNTTGGLERDFRYAGHGDYVTTFDMDKLFGLKGNFIKLRAEHRFGQSIGGTTGSLLPPTILAELPGDTGDVLLTDVLVTQFLSEEFAVFAGKMTTMDGDANAFAHGRGMTQFSNLAFVINPVALRTVPYSTLAAGFVYLVDLEPVFTFSVLNPVDTASTIGIDDLFANGATVTAELRLPTTFFSLPGHQLVGATWSSREYNAIGQDPRIILPRVPVASESGSWSLYWNFDQYLFTQTHDPKKGWGVFGRAGMGDDETNPLAWFLSFGVGGDSPLAGREFDSFGAGWYYMDLADDLGSAFGPLVNLQNGHGVELYYNIGVTKWFHITPDLQILKPVFENADTAVVAGLRSNIAF